MGPGRVGSGKALRCPANQPGLSALLSAPLCSLPPLPTAMQAHGVGWLNLVRELAPCSQDPLALNGWHRLATWAWAAWESPGAEVPHLLILKLTSLRGEQSQEKSKSKLVRMPKRASHPAGGEIGDIR